MARRSARRVSHADDLPSQKLAFQLLALFADQDGVQVLKAIQKLALQRFGQVRELRGKRCGIEAIGSDHMQRGIDLRTHHTKPLLDQRKDGFSLGFLTLIELERAHQIIKRAAAWRDVRSAIRARVHRAIIACGTCKTAPACAIKRAASAPSIARVVRAMKAMTMTSATRMAVSKRSAKTTSASALSVAVTPCSVPSENAKQNHANDEPQNGRATHLRLQQIRLSLWSD